LIKGYVVKKIELTKQLPAVPQRGFTLIEMSIVLVIIGLIIGGILKGQEIIESSRSKNVLSEVERIRAATNTFFDRYQALPGDFALATTRVATAGLTNGTGDGVIGTNAAATVAAILAIDAGVSTAGGAHENIQFFNHLALAKLIGGITLSAVAVTFGEASAAPAAAFPGTGYSLAYGLYPGTSPATAHWLRLSKSSGASLVATAGLLAKQLQQVDVRIDDGIPDSGTVRSGILAAPCGTAGNNDYAPTTESVSCVMFVNLVQ
jgi:prepilin-type N-terminal cleavage/methylation domain-containing protein